MVSHANLMHVEALIHEAFAHGPATVVLGWLPFQHDMGLIGNVIQPVYAGAECVLMTPTSFLKRPLRWLQAISDHRATTSGAPGFAYEMCVEEAARHGAAGIDLSSWGLAFIGAEPVRAGTLDRFARVFAPHGLRREALYPCYGLAEATLMVSGGRRADPPRVRAFPWADGGGEALRVSCGPVRPGLSLAIVDPSTGRCVEGGAEGEIWVRGPSVARGYFGQPEVSAAVFTARVRDDDAADREGEGPWLRTGDLGCLVDGDLFVTGRIKDVVVLKGVKYAAEDVEQAVDRDRPAPLRAGACAVFAHDDGEAERLVVVQEVERGASAVWSEVAERIASSLAEDHGVPAHVIALVRAGSIPRTTSGKVRRSACRELFAQRALDEVHRHTARIAGR
jgi:acyl-CoA synthetase (AMP-forming)/AMP-acid ligase II